MFASSWSLFTHRRRTIWLGSILQLSFPVTDDFPSLAKPFTSTTAFDTSAQWGWWLDRRLASTLNQAWTDNETVRDQVNRPNHSGWMLQHAEKLALMHHYGTWPPSNFSLFSKSSIDRQGFAMTNESAIPSNSIVSSLLPRQIWVAGAVKVVVEGATTSTLGARKVGRSH